MAFVSGDKITASDYNSLLALFNNVYAVGSGNSGYGESALSEVIIPPPHEPGRLIDNASWLSLRNAIEQAGIHQGTALTLPSISDIEEGDIIQAFTSLSTAVDLLVNNKLIVNAVNTVVDSSVLTDVRSATWGSQIKHTFTADFGSDDNARHFFNSGGQIRLTMSAPNTTAAHNWGGIYSSAGTFIFNHLEYYAMSSTLSNPVESFIHATGGGGAYSYYTQPNAWQITSRFVSGTSANGARGSKIEFSSKSTDVYSPAAPSSPDSVIGTFTSTIGERRSVTIFNQPSPIYSTVVALADGL